MRKVQVLDPAGARFLLPGGQTVNLQPGVTVLVDDPPRYVAAGGLLHVAAQLPDGRKGVIAPLAVLSEAEVARTRPAVVGKPAQVDLPGSLIVGKIPLGLLQASAIAAAGLAFSGLFTWIATRRK